MFKLPNVVCDVISSNLCLREWSELRACCSLTRNYRRKRAWSEARIGQVSCSQLRAWTGLSVVPELHIGHAAQCHQEKLKEPDMCSISSPHWIIYLTDLCPRCKAYGRWRIHWLWHDILEMHYFHTLLPSITSLTFNGTDLATTYTSTARSRDLMHWPSVDIPTTFSGTLTTQDIALNGCSCDVRSLHAWHHIVTGHRFVPLFSGGVQPGSQIRQRQRTRNLTLHLHKACRFTLENEHIAQIHNSAPFTVQEL